MVVHWSYYLKATSSNPTPENVKKKQEDVGNVKANWFKRSAASFDVICAAPVLPSMNNGLMMQRLAGNNWAKIFCFCRRLCVGVSVTRFVSGLFIKSHLLLIGLL